ncbi:hypothetical protein HY490_05215 [Candidatus Woesearchaeota archaeon]|nr:hypothetical protein [Candidatus Woesearchaeota archaeon]
MAPNWKVRRPLTEHEEFEVVKMVLDKFLWLGTALLGIGLFTSIEQLSAEAGLYYIIAGTVIMGLFGWIIVKEFEFSRVK